MDATAYNYNPTATVERNDECVYEGCVVPIALNFDSVAGVHDNTCRYTTPGCTDSTQLGYVADATEDDGSCVPRVAGCAHEVALNHDSAATVATATCRYAGCTNPEAVNYVAAATDDDGSCAYLLPGCMSEGATNYDFNANIDDGSCTYVIEGCLDANALNYLPTATTFSLDFCRCAGCTDPTAPNCNSNADADDGSCALAGCTASYAVNYAPSANVDDGLCFVLGCTDSTATNYEPLATTDDYSCVSSIVGCADSRAVSYRAAVNVHDASECAFVGCTAAHATNYDATATADDGSCTYVYATGTVASFGYLQGCVTYVDGDGDAAHDSGDATGYYSTPYASAGSTRVFVAPSAGGSTCVDSISGSQLSVPLLTEADAAMLTPLTSVAVFVREQQPSLSQADASALLSAGFSLTSEDVWSFDALVAALFGTPPMAVGDVSWFVRQMQVQTSVTCVKEAYSAHAGTYELALASYAELASMLTTQATIDLSSEADFTTLIEGAKARLNVTGAPASFVASTCAPINAALQGIIDDLGRRRSRSLVQSSGGDARRLQDDDSTGVLCDVLSLQTSVSFASYFPSASNQCVDGSLAASTGCTLAAAANYDSTAVLGTVSFCTLPGCTDSAATNYDSRASLDDSSCVAFAYGCTVEGTSNYDADATTYDGSSEFETPGCTDAAAVNFDAAATVVDGSCPISSSVWGYFDPDVLEVSACTPGTVNGYVCTIIDIFVLGIFLVLVLSASGRCAHSASLDH